MQGTENYKVAVIKDDEGKSHTYHIVPHGGGDGWPLALKVLKIIGPVVGKSMDGLTLDLDKVAKAAAEIKKGASDILSGSKFDLSKLGFAVGDLASALLADQSLVSDLLQFTQRDAQDLGNPAVFAQAYQANYLELMQAIGQVVMINFGPFLIKRLGSSQKLQAVTTMLQEVGGVPQTAV